MPRKLRPPHHPPTINELVAALTATLDQPDFAGATSTELRDRIGWGSDRMNAELNRLWKAGQLVVRRVQRLSRDGIRRYFTLYSIKKKP